MELLLIPILFLTGAALFHLGVNGAPSFAHLAPGTLPSMTMKSVRTIPDRLFGMAPTEHLSAPDTQSEPDPLQLADVLLADLLTEMVQFREELESLRNQVATLTAAAQAEPESSPRKRTIDAA